MFSIFWTAFLVFSFARCSCYHSWHTHTPTRKWCVPVPFSKPFQCCCCWLPFHTIRSVRNALAAVVVFLGSLVRVSCAFLTVPRCLPCAQCTAFGFRYAMWAQIFIWIFHACTWCVNIACCLTLHANSLKFHSNRTSPAHFLECFVFGCVSVCVHKSVRMPNKSCVCYVATTHTRTQPK